MPATTRHARSEDERDLRTIDHLTWSPLSSPSPAPPPERPFFRPGVEPQDVVVAELTDESSSTIVGYVHLGPALPVQAAAHVLEVKGLAVDPAHQSKGIGRALIQAAIIEARARSARKLTLRVLSPNTTARALYERSGFTTEGVLKNHFRTSDDGYIDDILMALDLTAAADQ